MGLCELDLCFLTLSLLPLSLLAPAPGPLAAAPLLRLLAGDSLGLSCCSSSGLHSRSDSESSEDEDDVMDPPDLCLDFRGGNVSRLLLSSSSSDSSSSSSLSELVEVGDWHSVTSVASRGTSVTSITGTTSSWVTGGCCEGRGVEAASSISISPQSMSSRFVGKSSVLKFEFTDSLLIGILL